MLILKLELLPHSGGPRQTLGEVAIHNVGGDDLLGSYRCFLSKDGFRNPSIPTKKETVSVGSVSRFPRALGAWALVERALKVLVKESVNAT